MEVKAKSSIRTWTRAEALDALRNFCSFQERSEKQVLRKIHLLGIQEFEEYLIEKLKEEGFLNDERFIESYIRGKSRIKGWGPKKIEAYLARETGKKIQTKQLIDEDTTQAAQQKFWQSLEKKWLLGPGKKSESQFKTTLLRFGLSKGFSYELVSGFIQDLELKHNPKK